jgi:hypothetical protein
MRVVIADRLAIDDILGPVVLERRSPARGSFPAIRPARRR